LGVAVLSSHRRAGRSTIAAGLTYFLATSGRRVLLIDADKPGHGQGRLLVASSQPLPPSDADARDARLIGAALYRWVGPQFNGGSISTIVLDEGLNGDGIHPTQRDSDRRLEGLLGRLEAQADFVLVDAPAVHEAGPALDVIRRYKWAVAVVPHHAPVREVAELAQMIIGVGLQPIGYIYNHLPRRGASALPRVPSLAAGPAGAEATSAA
jgi:Mrp family chromosome partitioning ATPase